MIDFKEAFKVLTGTEGPFPWQIELFEKWFVKGKFPHSCNLPTGLGKTSVIAIWLIALINHPEKMPHRRIGLYGCCRFHGFNAVAPLKGLLSLGRDPNTLEIPRPQRRGPIEADTKSQLSKGCVRFLGGVKIPQL